MRFAHINVSRLVPRAIAAILLGAMGAPLVTLPAAALVPIRALAGGAPAQTLLGADVAACSQIKPADVAAVIATRRAARVVVTPAIAPPVARWKDNPTAYHAWLEKTKPHTPVTMTIHPMTTLEFATFRAAQLLDTNGGTFASAVSSCRTEANARFKSLHARVIGANALHPMWQSCGPQPCPCPPTYTRSNASNGTYGILAFRSICTGEPSANAVYTAGGGVYSNANAQYVTISNYPGAKSPIPAAQNALPTKYGTITQTLPSPEYVPQTGYDAIPGAKDSNGNQLYAYLNQTDHSAAASFSSSFWISAEYTTAQNGTVTADGYYDDNGSTGYTPTLAADSNADTYICAGAILALMAAADADELGELSWGAILEIIGDALTVAGSCPAVFNDYGVAEGDDGQGEPAEGLF